MAGKRSGFMNIQEMISKMSPEMLSKGLKQMSGMLSPEQLKQMENAIKNTDKGEMNRRLNALNGADLQKELQNNPMLAKKLSQNPELMNQINAIFNNGRGK